MHYRFLREPSHIKENLLQWFVWCFLLLFNRLVQIRFSNRFLLQQNRTKAFVAALNTDNLPFSEVQRLLITLGQCDA